MEEVREVGRTHWMPRIFFHLDLSDCFSIILLQQTLSGVFISPFGRDVSLVREYHSSSAYTAVIGMPVCSPAVFTFIQMEYKEVSQD